MENSENRYLIEKTHETAPLKSDYFYNIKMAEES